MSEHKLFVYGLLATKFKKKYQSEHKLFVYGLLATTSFKNISLNICCLYMGYWLLATGYY